METLKKGMNNPRKGGQGGSEMKKALWILAALTAIWFISFQSHARGLVAPEWRRFEEVARGDRKVIDMGDYRLLDYGGRLAEVVDQRNRKLSQHGVRMLGSWRVVEGSPIRQSLYLPASWRLRRK